MKEEIKEFFESQLKNWELARRNFEALNFVKKKPFKCGVLNGFVQYNPARSVSTLAKVDKNSIANRKCFLCDENRPNEQMKFELIPGWNLLVNPFPILPFHFTIVNSKHTPQKLDVETGIELARQLPRFVVFFNDDGAGASAPDHMHFQAVPIEELPLIKLLDTGIKDLKTDKLPFKILTEKEEIKTCKDPMNVYFWLPEVDKEVKFIAIPRKAHRPREYDMQPPSRRAISPGAIDMAGIIVTPIEEDFDLTVDKDIENIYHQVGFIDE
ncbi:MAG: DUF4922 domain-containing protein [Muribaculaceae bacterium]|nr:DUF4922 domain-containing protein [Muribaculaceae bacterium]